MQAWSNKNSLEETKFELLEKGFNHSGFFYEFDQIESIKFARLAHQARVLFVGTETYDHSVGMKIYMMDGEELSLSEKPTWTSKSKKNNIKEVEEIISFINAKTLKNRLKKYTDQIKKNSYFFYNGWNINPVKKTFICLKNKNVYHFESTKFTMSGYLIALSSKTEGKLKSILNKTGRHFLGVSPGYDHIEIFEDQDVFLILLKHYFELHWSSIPYKDISSTIP